MSRPVTLMTAQWGDLEFEALCKLAKEMGYDGLEMMCCSHIDPERAAKDLEYCAQLKATMDKYGLKCWALAAHIIGQCVGDIRAYGPVHDAFCRQFPALPLCPGQLPGGAGPESVRIYRAAYYFRGRHALPHSVAP